MINDAPGSESTVNSADKRSVNYNALLSPYDQKGIVGRKEIYDDNETVNKMVERLADHWRQAKFVVVLTGAGVSTSAGIADFRGPNGVWTLEKKGITPIEANFGTAVPTKTHMALCELEKQGKLQWLISQNVDGLHLKSGFPRNRIAELHGNLYKEICNKCKTEHFRNEPIESVGFKPTGRKCERGISNNRNCRGMLHDATLDWNDALPEDEYEMSLNMLKKCDLFVVLGTSLEILPIGGLPLKVQKRGVPVYTVNLQETKYEKKILNKIHDKVDSVFVKLMETLEYSIPEYVPCSINKFSVHPIPIDRTGKKRKLSN